MYALHLLRTSFIGMCRCRFTYLSYFYIYLFTHVSMLSSMLILGWVPLKRKFWKSDLSEE